MSAELTVQCHQEWARLLLDVMQRLSAATTTPTSTNNASDGSPVTLAAAVAASSVPRYLVGLVAHLALRQSNVTEMVTSLDGLEPESMQSNPEAVANSLSSIEVSGELHAHLEPRLDVGTSADLVAALVTLASANGSCTTTSSWVYNECFKPPLVARMAMVLAVRTAPGSIAPVLSNGEVSPQSLPPLRPPPPPKSMTSMKGIASASPQARTLACTALGDLLELGFSGRLKPFKAQFKVAMSKDEPGVGRLPGWRATAKVSACALLARLEDGHQEVRVAAANALSSLWPFAAPSDMIAGVPSSSDGSDEWEVVEKSELHAGSTRSYEGAWLSLDDILSVCLPLVATQADSLLPKSLISSSDQGKSSDDEDEDDDEDDDGDPTAALVEAALREGAIVGAECFLRHLTSARKTAKTAPRLANLESHGELLVSLEAAKAANQKRVDKSLSSKVTGKAAMCMNEFEAAGSLAEAVASETTAEEETANAVHDRGTDLEELD